VRLRGLTARCATDESDKSYILLSAMAKDIELAILFADVVGSTMLYETLGDEKARAMVGICIDVMRSATEQFQGTVIKTMGDEVMATFSTADEALNAANQMQRTISTRPALQNDTTHVAIRIGCHFGPVVLENRDVFGAAVHTANRMTSQAKAGQIITTVTMVEKLSPEWRAAVRQIDVATLKGRSHEVALYEVLWQTEDITSMLPAIALANRETQRPRRLRLRYQGEELVLDDRRTAVTIGRAEDNDIIVKGNLISRLHARIELNKARFMLVDQSTNGTFVHGAAGDEQFVRRDSLAIAGEGLIGLGRAPERDSSQTIRFVCEE
jgi:adenylate cyclase